MMTNTFLKTNNSYHSSFRLKSFLSRCLLLVTACIMLTQAKCQSDKRLVMADQYFAAGDYFTAARLYGQFLSAMKTPKYRSDFPLNVRRGTEGRPGKYKNSNDIVFKQAESYRMANYWAEASALYKTCFEKDSAGYASALYWYAVCQRSMGNYAVAEESLTRFTNGMSESNEWYRAVIREKEILAFVKTQLTRPDSIMYHVQKISTKFGDHGVFAPFAKNDREIFFTSTLADSVKGSVNPYHNRLFSSTLVDNDLSVREPLLIEAIDSSMNQGAASISADGNHLYFTQWKKENGQTVSAIYYSNKTAKGWSAPQLLSSANEPGHSSKQPFCSPDGKYLFFASDRTGGKGGFDIWWVSLQPDGSASEAVNAGDINSPANEQAPFYHVTTGTLVFASDRTPGMGGYDLFAAKGTPTAWKVAENMGAPVNSPRDDIYFFASEKGGLLDNAIVSSDRGSECCLAIYDVAKTAKRRMITGQVIDCAINQPLDSATVTLTDASGKNWQTVTDPDGKYRFYLSDNESQHQLIVSREKYNEKAAVVAVEGVDESNWRTDTLRNAAFCLEKTFVLKVENVVTVYFDYDKSDLKDRATLQLDSIYNIMVANPACTVQLSGYTDGRGTVEYNKKLSEKRATSCADYLIQKGIAASRISIQSFGALYPAEMELINGRDNAEGRSKNRRVLINVSKE